MAHTRRELFALACGVASLPIAGCTGLDVGGDGDEMETTTTVDQGTGATDEPTDTSEETTTENTTEADGRTLAVRSTASYGEVVVGPEGMSLYMFEMDPPDGTESVCTGDCADAWPPLTVADPGDVTVAESISGAVNTIERADGSTQVTLGGWPLYYFQGDAEPGDLTGQGVNDVWWLLAPDGTPLEPVVQVRSHQDLGSILTGPDGMTVYMFDQDTRGSGESSCRGGCVDAWPPLTVEDQEAVPLASDAVSAPVGTIERTDGSMQVTVDGWPLYYFQNDGSEGDVTGQGVNDVWWVLEPDGTVRRPAEGSGSSETTQTENGPGGGY